MLYALIFLIFCSCFSCQSAETNPAIEPAKPVDSISASISSWQTMLLLPQQKAQEGLAQEIYLKTLPKLPGGDDFFGTLQLKALESGSQKSLKRLYQNISTPHKNNAYEATKHLDLSYQNIYYIPNKVTNYPNLRYLSLSNNQIQAINPKLAHCKKLRKLDLSSNGIKKLPFGLIYLTQINELVLADNNLNSLPSYFYNLGNLTIVDISNLHTGMATCYNNIQQFPAVLTKMPKVEKLFLEKLPLRNLPSTIRKMTNLQVLSLNGNRSLNLNQAFNALSQLPDLIALDLSFIGRRSLPKNIDKLKNLKILIWHEEGQRNRTFVEETLKEWLPNTKIYYGKKGVATPFLRGNSITMIRNLANE
ncbi:leucine-rich repeat domain-containing protein [Aureispira anguillae]|uniref:Leucine-rich repeat domain-containing protein n=1 Tax=Aureispira anguillae TaxID=2864201 RepID=A0A915YAQ1_9BACT|nr:leucine-rich repeat domain-containing protein [Aureispira anguillae]BDS09361.1 leucine-rich repeat domain-containing protein [Aureispira anguillae]